MGSNIREEVNTNEYLIITRSGRLPCICVQVNTQWGYPYVTLVATLMTTSWEEKDEYLTYLIVSVNTLWFYWFML